MHEIIENASLEMTNVLTFRGKVTQQQFIQINKEMYRNLQIRQM